MPATLHPLVHGQVPGKEGGKMTAYDEVLNAPDQHTRKEALDKLCKEREVHVMRKIARNLSLAAHNDRIEILDNAAELEKGE